MHMSEVIEQITSSVTEIRVWKRCPNQSKCSFDGVWRVFFLQEAACGKWVTDMPVIQKRRVLCPCCEAEWQHNTVRKGKRQPQSRAPALCIGEWQATPKKDSHIRQFEFFLQSSKWNESEWVKDFSCKLTSQLWPAKLLEMDLFWKRLKITSYLLVFSIMKRMHL